MAHLYLIWIRTRLAIIFGFHCSAVITKAKLGLLTRKDVNQRISKNAKKMLRLLKTTYTTKAENPLCYKQDQPIIFMSNHQSLMDLPLIYATIPGTIRVMAKEELFRIPLFGQAMNKADFISINRTNPDSSLFQQVKEKLQDNIRLWVFPEGTRSRDGTLLSFKPGSFRLARELNALIIPVGISGTKNILPADTLHFQLNQQAQIHIGEPIDSSKFTMETQHLLLERVRDTIAKLMENSRGIVE